MSKLSGKHILLLLLHSPGGSGIPNESIVGRTRLVKMMFLFDKEVGRDFTKGTALELVDFPTFDPWKYGPFSKEVYNDLEFFVNNGFIDTQASGTQQELEETEEYAAWLTDYHDLSDDEMNPVNATEEFKLSEFGMRFVETKILPTLVENQKKILVELKTRVNGATLASILRYTYLKYPEYAVASAIRGRVIGY